MTPDCLTFNVRINRMKRFIIAGLLSACMAATVSAQQKELFILQTSDTHSRIEPIPPQSSDQAAGMGGVVRRAAFVKEFRSEHPDVLLFDCGDISQGTPYYNLFKGEVEIKAMNLMKYDAMTIGNHEFDFGLSNMARLFRMAAFPVVCANYDMTGTVLEGIVKPYVIFERGGLKIGVFGISPKLEGLVQADKCEGVVYKDPVATAQEMADLLKNKEHCDVVVCLSHLGILPGADESGEYDNNLVAKTCNIDVILGGHTHTNMEHPAVYLNAGGKDVPIMHVGKSGAYVGKLKLTLEAE